MDMFQKHLENVTVMMVGSWRKHLTIIHEKRPLDLQLLSNEAVLIRNALSEEEQNILFKLLKNTNSRSVSPSQLNSERYPTQDCDLRTWDLHETSNQTTSRAITTRGVSRAPEPHRPPTSR